MPLSSVPTIQEGFLSMVSTFYSSKAKKLSLHDSYDIAVSCFPQAHGFQAPYSSFHSFKEAWYAKNRKTKAKK